MRTAGGAASAWLGGLAWARATVISAPSLAAGLGVLDMAGRDATVGGLAGALIDWAWALAKPKIKGLARTMTATHTYGFMTKALPIG